MSDKQKVKEETFIQTSRKGGEMGSQGREESWQGGTWQTQWRGWQSRKSHICMWINQEEQRGSKTNLAIQGSSTGK